MGFFDRFQQPAPQAAPIPGGTTLDAHTSVQPQRVTDGQPGLKDDWERQVWADMQRRYPNDPAKQQEQLEYFRGKRYSGELMGNNQPADDNYWLSRSSGNDPQDQPGYGGGMYGGGQGFSLQGANGLASFNAPGLLAPYTQQFQAPDPANMAASPSFQWTMGRGLDALEKFHGAKGTLNTGGAGKDAMEFAGGVASQEYDKDWNRNFNLWGANANIFNQNKQNTFNMLNATAGNGQQAASSYANNVTGIQQNQANSNAANSVNQNTGWGNLAGEGLDTLGAWLFNRGKG